MSNLSQIQNLVKTLRKKFRNSNNIEEIKQFLAQYEWDKDLSHSYYNTFKEDIVQEPVVQQVIPQVNPNNKRVRPAKKRYLIKSNKI